MRIKKPKKNPPKDENATQTSISDNSQKGQMDNAIGEHLSTKDPEYWNSLSDETKKQYNENQSQQWTNYLLKSNEKEEE